MESGAIADEQISASTEFGPSYAAKYGRLHLERKPGSVGSWSSFILDTNQWLQIDLADDRTSISRVATQGGNQYNQFVTKYRLQYSEDGVTFHYYSEQGQGQAKVILPSATAKDNSEDADIDKQLRLFCCDDQMRNRLALFLLLLVILFISLLLLLDLLRSHFWSLLPLGRKLLRRSSEGDSEWVSVTIESDPLANSADFDPMFPDLWNFLRTESFFRVF